MPKLLSANSLFTSNVQVPEEGDDAFAETLEEPLQILLNRTEYLYDQVRELTALVEATSILEVMPALEAVPANLTPRHLKVDMTGVEEGRIVHVHLAAFSISEPDRRPIYISDFSDTFSLTSGESKVYANLPANLYYSISFDAGYGFFNQDTYYFLGTKHPVFKIGRMPVNTAAAPFLFTFEAQRAVPQKPVTLELDRVAPNQLILINLYRDMNSSIEPVQQKIFTRLERTSSTGITSIALGNFDGGLYWINIEGQTAELSDSGSITTAFTINASNVDSGAVTISIEGIR